MTAIDAKLIDRFLLGEMKQSEVKDFEEQLFSDDELFFAVAQKEEELLDKYVRGQLPEAVRTKFEATFARMPARLERLKHAAVLAEVIHEEAPRASAKPSILKPSLVDRLFRFLGFRSLQLGFTVCALIMALTIAVGFLGFRDIQREREIALNRPNARLEGLERELSHSLTRVEELQRQVDQEREVAADLTTDLESERNLRNQLERETASIQRRVKTPSSASALSHAPNVGAVTLSPMTNDEQPKSYQPLQNIRRVAIVIKLPSDFDLSGRVSIRLNGVEIDRDLRVRVGAEGAKTVSVAVSSDSLRSGTNRFTVHNATGLLIAEYALERAEED